MSYTDFDFPHSDYYRSDLRQLIADMKNLEENMADFIHNESITFADPITWSITTQYSKNTIVLNTEGNAYLSKVAVPSGVQLNNDEYWLEIFNFTNYTRTANKNLTLHVETNTTRATEAYESQDWLIWNDKLYKVMINIAADDLLVAGENIVRFTVEEFCKDWIDDIQEQYDSFTADTEQQISGYYQQTQQQIDQIIAGATVDSEVINARVAYSSKQYTTLKERLDAEVQALQFHNNLKTFILGGIGNDGHLIQGSTNRVITPLMTLCQPHEHFKIDAGYKIKLIYYNEPALSSATFLYAQPAWVTSADGFYHVNDTYNGKYFIMLVGKTDDTDFTADEVKEMANHIQFMPVDWTMKGDYISDGSTIDLNDWKYLTQALCVGQSKAQCTVLNCPDDFTDGEVTGFTLITLPNTFRVTTTEFCTQIFYTQNAAWYRIVQVNRGSDNISFYKNWTYLFGEPYTSKLFNKNVVILGASISTNNNTNYPTNVPEILIGNDDVGQTLSAYITYYDVQASLEINGYTYQTSDIGNEVTFTPTESDVGKMVGRSQNYNPTSIKPWWVYVQEEFGCNIIPNAWSGASISSHQGDTNTYKASYAWHDAMIRKCGIRQAGTMNRTAPDLIIITRGVNDMTHNPYTRLTSNYFDNYNWQYPTTDDLGNDKFGFLEGLALTIKKLRTAYPNTPIMLATFTEFYRINYSHFPVNNGINSVKQYNEAIRKAADFFGCKLIEFDKDGIVYENAASYARDTPPVHPNNAGHKIMGKQAINDIANNYITV